MRYDDRPEEISYWWDGKVIGYIGLNDSQYDYYEQIIQSRNEVCGNYIYKGGSFKSSTSSYSYYKICRTSR